ncbi:UDP-2,3-diacylglucosamine diphosphatase [Candidatus Berkiella cookevillensis]|uniref:UDP-2,3-diacylglucosamine hydrolase n=1 Tax=Candidatus Berkiella cookevillensis TaxID=437022 RepID=A0A0Q9Y9E7_9GAMM|nr:UDP-2,3-diacylglucosamine diphosphatase [Candidatus Berkiella cookevillensis]MCS5708772.1 UDP-2,3-diacylglucosamine diphosphatase [Candidatus Berkiella cookevillensis]
MTLSKNHTLFVSDVHLSENKPELTALFLKFINEKALFAQELYILGDLFDVWLGDDLIGNFEHEIATALETLANAGVKTYFLAGNRDFFVGEKFLKLAKITALKDPCEISIFGYSLLLTHGDLLCTDDKLYQRYRSFVQNPLSRKIFLRFPIQFRKLIARKLRSRSKQYQQRQPIAKLDVTEEGVQKILAQKQANVIIHGHVHRANTINHNVNGRVITRYVLGTWHHTGSYIVLDTQSVEIKVFQ